MDITSSEKNNNIIMSLGENDDYGIQYYHTEFHFYIPETFIRFIEGVEKIVRSSESYKAYIDYLKNTIGLRTCSIYGYLQDEHVTIEMHHGPCFTLFDYVKIIVDYRIDHNLPLDTFQTAQQVMGDHGNNIIQVVNLCVTAHQAVHANNTFIPMTMSWGNLRMFLSIYGPYMDNTLKLKLRNYFEKWIAYEKGTLNQENIFKVKTVSHSDATSFMQGMDIWEGSN